MDERTVGQQFGVFGISFRLKLTLGFTEDIMMRIISFSQQGSRAICILAANGTISNVTLLQPNSSGGTLTYEGRFEILSLTGSFMPSDNGLTKSRSGGLSVSLAGSDGRVLGGGLASMLVAAGPVQYLRIVRWGPDGKEFAHAFYVLHCCNLV
ncbi:AT-hook motif nuclear-localized protein 1 [Orobanche minor]